MRKIDLGATESLTIPQISLCVDPGVPTLIAQLEDPNLGESNSRSISVYKVENYPWLLLTISGNDGNDNTTTRITRDSPARIQLSCIDKVPDDIVEGTGVEKLSLRLSSQLANGNKPNYHNITVGKLVLTTRKLPAPDIKLDNISDITISHRKRDKENVIQVGWMTIEQPPPAKPLQYQGPELCVKWKVEAEIKSPDDLVGQKLKSYLTTTGNAVQDDSVGHGKTLLPQGNPITCICSFDYDELYKYAKSAPEFEVDLAWSCCVIRGEDTSTGNNLEPRRSTVRVSLKKDEFFILNWIGFEEFVPRLTEDGGAQTVSQKRYIVRYHKGEICQKNIFLSLESIVEQSISVKMETTIDQCSFTPDSDPLIKNATLAYGKLETVKVDVENLLNSKNLARLPENFHLEIKLDVEVSGKRLSGRVSIPVSVEGNVADYAYCIDFGASATVIWCGELDMNNGSSRCFLPLGDWARESFGTRAEYKAQLKPFGNKMLPTIISLDSRFHLRSKFDKLSLGSLERVGFDKKSAEARLTHYQRRYDLSIPAENHLNDHQNEKWRGGEDARFPAVLQDFKRRLMVNGDWSVRQSVSECIDGTVGETSMIKPSEMLDSLFSEFGSYIIPNALHYQEKHSTREKEVGLSKALQKAEPRQVKVIFTHPTGLNEKRAAFEQFKAAAKSCATKLLCSDNITEPSFVPEALATAYRAINGNRDSKFYACIDIGSSTFDASIVEVVNRNEQRSWVIKTHFGVPIGGLELDAALFDLVHAFFEQNFKRESVVKNPYTYQSDLNGNDSLLQRILPGCIQAAKESLSENCYGFSQGKNKVENLKPFDLFKIDVSDIVTSTQVGVRAGELTDESGIKLLTVESSSEESSSKVRRILEVPAALLMPTPLKAGAQKNDPCIVARLLGQALPALLLREIQRLGLRSVTWVVTGRASLWPAIYYSINTLVEGSDICQMVSKVPDSPEKQKQAAARGAVEIVAENVDIPNGPTGCYAIAELKLSETGHDTFSEILQISDIKYIATSGKDSGVFSIERKARRWLVRALPGLDQPYDGQDLSRSEIIDLLGLFGYPAVEKKIPVAHLRDGDEMDQIHWEWRENVMHFSSNNGNNFSDPE